MFIRALYAALFLLTPASIAFSQNVKVEKLEIATQSPTNYEFLTGKKDAKPARITGELRIPGAIKDKAPLVLLVHGSGGVGANIHYWVAQLNQFGIATFAIDSFTGRGVKDTIADQTQVSNFAMLGDAYRALELLAKHPRIDPDRIAIMGFSKGAIVALYSGMTRLQDMHLEKGLKFAAHVPFYPACGTEYIDDTKLAPAPIRIFHGAADDYTPLAPCRNFVTRAKAAGNDIAIFEYAGAHHAFDNPRIVAPIRLPKALTGRKCAFEEKRAGLFINKETGQRATGKDPCIERGATVAYSAAATAASTKQVVLILREVFKLK